VVILHRQIDTKWLVMVCIKMLKLHSEEDKARICGVMGDINGK
jgi:hypothetical protein